MLRTCKAAKGVRWRIRFEIEIGRIEWKEPLREEREEARPCAEERGGVRGGFF